MRRAFHIGLFIGTLIGMSACAAAVPADAGRTGSQGISAIGLSG